MSSAAAKSPVTDVLDYVHAWANSLAEILSQKLGSASACEVLTQTPVEAPSQAEGDFWVTATSSGGISGQLSFRLGAAATRRLARRPAGEVEDGDEAATAEDKTEVLELISKDSRSRQHAVQAHREGCPTAGGVWDRSLRGSIGHLLAAGKPPRARRAGVCLSDALLASLQTIQARPPISPVTADGAKNQLGMLMDVELVVTMRFGGRRMLLKDILDLCAGSVVELDQQVQEPVDLLLDGKLIARGEVVVVDGNYGLRVTELPSNAG